MIDLSYLRALAERKAEGGYGWDASDQRYWDAALDGDTLLRLLDVVDAAKAMTKAAAAVIDDECAGVNAGCRSVDELVVTQARFATALARVEER